MGDIGRVIQHIELEPLSSSSPVKEPVTSETPVKSEVVEREPVSA